MNYIDDLLITGRALLCLARKLDSEGKGEEAGKLYRLALKQGLLVVSLKHEANTNDQAVFIATPAEVSTGL